MSSPTAPASGSLPGSPQASIEPKPASANAASSRSARYQVGPLKPERRPVDWKSTTVTTGISLLIHVIVLFVCSMIVFDHDNLREIVTAIVSMQEHDEEPIVETTIQPDKIDENTSEITPQQSVTDFVSDVKSPVNLDISDVEPQVVIDEANLPGLADIKVGEQMAGRSSAVKSALVKKFGGSDASERAVSTGLKWLKGRQFQDGSWNFDHTLHPDNPGTWSQPGSLKEIRTGSTGLALLAFLGAGHTQKSGDFQEEIKDGLDALVKLGKPTPAGFDLRGVPGSGHGHTAMYSHAIATLALCEAVAMTKDARYRQQAESAVRFIVNSQDPKGGGWRYEPHDPGDTSVVGWKVMALKAASQAKMRVPQAAFRGAGLFLDSVQYEGGSQYSYTAIPKSPPTPTLSAAGLLCRMYLGWDNRRPALKAGVAYLDKVKPATNNMYYNYYATQVLHHWGGEEWDRWNDVMREQLVRTQLRDGPEAGSWDVADPHGSVGGRLFMTSLCVMTLEVYYRHLPLYQRDKVKVEF